MANLTNVEEISKRYYMLQVILELLKQKSVSRKAIIETVERFLKIN